MSDVKLSKQARAFLEYAVEHPLLDQDVKTRAELAAMAELQLRGLVVEMENAVNGATYWGATKEGRFFIFGGRNLVRPNR